MLASGPSLRIDDLEAFLAGASRLDAGSGPHDGVTRARDFLRAKVSGGAVV
jgi:hypothetical protein